MQAGRQTRVPTSFSSCRVHHRRSTVATSTSSASGSHEPKARANSLMLMIGRRRGLLLVGAAVLALGLGLYFGQPWRLRGRGGAAATGPVIFISIDTLRAD